MVCTNECSLGNKEEGLEASRDDGLCTGIREKANKADVVGICYRTPSQDGGEDEMTM